MIEPTTAALIEAIVEGDADQVHSLLRAGASPNAANAEGTTPLYAGAQNEAIEMVRGLLEAGAGPNVESKDESEGLPLCGAACWGSLETVVELLKHGADPNLREDGGTGATPFPGLRRTGTLTWHACFATPEVGRHSRRQRSGLAKTLSPSFDTGWNPRPARATRSSYDANPEALE